MTDQSFTFSFTLNHLSFTIYYVPSARQALGRGHRYFQLMNHPGRRLIQLLIPSKGLQIPLSPRSMLRDEGLLRDLSAPGLLCPSCEVQKLSADFPAPSQLPKDGLTEAERRFCCQCLKEKAVAIAKADPSNPATRILEQLKGAERASKFKALSEVKLNQSQGELNQVKVVRVTGAFSMVPAAPGMSVAEFKKRVQAAMAVASGRQRLVFKVRRSKSTSRAAVVVPVQQAIAVCPLTPQGKTLVDGKSLGHHGVHGDATITLIEQMYTTQGTTVSKLSFDLTWGFPARGRCEQPDHTRKGFSLLIRGRFAQ